MRSNDCSSSKTLQVGAGGRHVFVRRRERLIQRFHVGGLGLLGCLLGVVILARDRPALHQVLHNASRSLGPEPH